MANVLATLTKRKAERRLNKLMWQICDKWIETPFGVCKCTFFLEIKLEKHHINKFQLTSAGTYIKHKKLQPFLSISKIIYDVSIVLWSQTPKMDWLPPCDSRCSKIQHGIGKTLMLWYLILILINVVLANWNVSSDTNRQVRGKNYHLIEWLREKRK